MKKTILKLVLGTPVAITPVIGVVSCNTSWIKWDRNDSPSNLKFIFTSDKSPEDMWKTRSLKILKKAWDENTETINLEKLNNQFEFIKLFFEITNAKPHKDFKDYSYIENWDSFKKYIHEMNFPENIKIRYKNNIKDFDISKMSNHLNSIKENMEKGIIALKASITAKIVANEIVKEIKAKNIDEVEQSEKELADKIKKQISGDFASINIKWIKNSINLIPNKNQKNLLLRKLENLIDKYKKDFQTLTLLKQELEKQYTDSKNIDVLNSCLNNISAVAIQKKDKDLTTKNFKARLSDVVKIANKFLLIDTVKQFAYESSPEAIKLGFLTNLPKRSFKKFEKFIYELDTFISELFKHKSTFKQWSKDFNFLLNSQGHIKEISKYNLEKHTLKQLSEKSLKSEFIKEMISKR